VGVANLLYAASTLLTFACSWLLPSLATGTAARFVEIPLKHALKTPLSVLFYGAETPRTRVAARALVFGVAIPIASVVAGLLFRQMGSRVGLISAAGVALAMFYVAICAWQNLRYEGRLAQLLEGQLQDAPASVDLAALEEKLARIAASADPQCRRLIARTLAVPGKQHPNTQSLLALYMGEALPHRQAQAIRDAFVEILPKAK
jgi:hypothetical protein